MKQLKSWRLYSEITVSCEEYGKACETAAFSDFKTCFLENEVCLVYAKWGITPEENLRACMYHDG